MHAASCHAGSCCQQVYSPPLRETNGNAHDGVCHRMKIASLLEHMLTCGKTGFRQHVNAAGHPSLCILLSVPLGGDYLGHGGLNAELDYLLGIH